MDDGFGIGCGRLLPGLAARGSMTSPPGLASSARRSSIPTTRGDLGAVEIVLGTFGYRGRLHRTGLVRGRGGGQPIRPVSGRAGSGSGIDICGLRGLRIVTDLADDDRSVTVGEQVRPDLIGARR